MLHSPYCPADVLVHPRGVFSFLFFTIKLAVAKLHASVIKEQASTIISFVRHLAVFQLGPQDPRGNRISQGDLNLNAETETPKASRGLGNEEGVSPPHPSRGSVGAS